MWCASGPMASRSSVSDLTGSFIENLSTFYEDDQWHMYDDCGGHATAGIGYHSHANDPSKNSVLGISRTDLEAVLPARPR